MILALLLALLSDSRIAILPHATTSPSVLIIVADDLGQEPSGSTWSVLPPLMPKLADMAAQGVAFSRAYSWPVCSSTRAALYSGLYPRRGIAVRDYGLVTESRVGIGDVGTMNAHSSSDDRLVGDVVTIAEAFQITHRTALFGKWHLGRAPLAGAMNQISSGPLTQGFESWLAGNATAPNVGTGASGHYNWSRITDGQIGLASAYATDAQRDELLAWWVATPGPKFAVLATSGPHAPFDAPPGYADQPTDRADYAQCATYLDDVVEDVLATVDVAQDFVVFTGDNGCPDAARPTGTPAGHWKGSTYEGGIRVPLVIAGPGVFEGVTSSRLVSLVDIPSTLFELIGMDPSGGFQDSLTFADALGAWAGGKPRAFVLSERYDIQAITDGYPIGYDDLAIVRVNWKYRNVNGVASLYHISVDPFESTPFSPSSYPLVMSSFTADLATLPVRL